MAGRLSRHRIVAVENLAEKPPDPEEVAVLDRAIQAMFDDVAQGVTSLHHAQEEATLLRAVVCATRGLEVFEAAVEHLSTSALCCTQRA